MRWIHESPEWNHDFSYDVGVPPLEDIENLENLISLRLKNLGTEEIGFLQLVVLEREILANSRIERIELPEEAVRSSLFRRLAIPFPIRDVFRRNAQNCMEVMVDAVGNHSAVDLRRLLSWQSRLVDDRSMAGRLRNENDGDMRVVSGPAGFEKIHYVAPRGERVEREMSAFLERLHAFSAHPVIRAGLAHLRLVLIHPFLDGNGRTARTLSDHILACAKPDIGVFAGMSQSFLKDWKGYGDFLDRICRVSCMDTTEWLAFVCEKRLASLEFVSTNIDCIVRQHDFLHRAKSLGYDGNILSALYRISRPDFSGRVDARKFSIFIGSRKDDARFLLDRLETDGLMRKNGKTWEPVLEAESDCPKPDPKILEPEGFCPR